MPSKSFLFGFVLLFFAPVLFAQDTPGLWMRRESKSLLYATVIERQGDVLLYEHHNRNHGPRVYRDTLIFDAEQQVYSGKNIRLKQQADGSLVSDRKHSKVYLPTTERTTVNQLRNELYAWQLRLDEGVEVNPDLSLTLPTEEFRIKADSSILPQIQLLRELEQEKMERAERILRNEEQVDANRAFVFLKEFNYSETDFRVLYHMGMNYTDAFLVGYYDRYIPFNQMPADLPLSALREKVKASPVHNPARRKLLRKLKH